MLPGCAKGGQRHLLDNSLSMSKLVIFRMDRVSHPVMTLDQSGFDKSANFSKAHIPQGRLVW